MWWMVSFPTRQIRHVPSSSILKTCFLICLVEIASSWMAATVESVDLFRVENFSHWLDRFVDMRLVKVFCKLPMHVISFEFRFQFVDACGFDGECRFDGEFTRQFPHGSQLLNIMANFITMLLRLLVDRFFSSGYLPV